MAVSGAIIALGKDNEKLRVINELLKVKCESQKTSLQHMKNHLLQKEGRKS